MYDALSRVLTAHARPVMGPKRAAAVGRWVEHLDPRFRASLRRLRTFQNRYAGRRCFILGNGPSLNRTDLSLLKNELTFGTNRIYLLQERTGFAPSFYVAVNDLVVQQFAGDVADWTMPKFIGWHCRGDLPFTDQTVFLHTRSGLRSWFYSDLTEGCWEGNTVTYVCMQLAWWMGFSEVILVGVDHNYRCQGKPHERQDARGDDPNHFDPRYFSDGHRWDLPDLEGSELAYRIAKYMFETTGRRIVDATIDGKLQVFPKVDYASLFPPAPAADVAGAAAEPARAA